MAQPRSRYFKSSVKIHSMFADPIRSTYGLHYPSSYHSNVVGTGYIHKEQKAYEMAMIEVPNTIIYPRAVMVLVTLAPAFSLEW